MHVLTMIGLALGGGVIAVDHLIRRIPSKLAVILYTAAVALMIAGMIIKRSAGA